MNTLITRLTRGEAGFDRHIADRVFNELPFDRAPDLIAIPRSEAEIIEVVREARRTGQKLAILSGGHSWIGAPLRAGGVLIDMSTFDRIEVDAASRTARVGPAARSGSLAKTLAAHGLAFPSGHCGTPGFGGYVLGGGIGLNTGQWKPACYSLRSVRVVTATGELVVASAADRHDLLWLARGSGPSFPGVITEFEIELQNRPADTHVSSWLFAFEELAAVSRWISAVSSQLPSNVEVATAALGLERPVHPPSDGFPDHVVAVSAMIYADDAEEAREAVTPMAAGPGTPPLAKSDLEPVPFELLHEAFDAEYLPGHRYLADSFWSDRDVEGVLMPLQETFRRAPSGKSNVIALMPANGSKLGLSAEFGAYSMDERTLVMPYAIWTDPASDDTNRSWMSEMSEILASVSTGHFISEADLDAYPDRLPRSFTTANWERVHALRAQWDPDGVFHIPGQRT